MRLTSFVLSGVLIWAALPADAADDAFTAACIASNNLEPAVCACCATKARSRLSPLGYEFLVASLQGDEAKTGQLRSKLSIQEAIQASTFMIKTPGECAKELQGQP